MYRPEVQQEWQTDHTDSGRQGYEWGGGFRFARLDIHGGLLARARAEAEAALKRDARLADEKGRGLRLLLYLFERDEAARLIEAG